MKIDRFVVGMLGSNSYLVTDEKSDRCVLIDAPFPESSYLHDLRKIGKRLEWILLTHRHYDHLMAVPDIVRLTGAQVAISSKDAEGLTSEYGSEAATMGFAGMQQTYSPDRLLHEGDTVVVGELTFRVMETPGHSVGSVCYFCNDVIFSGDTLFEGSIGRTDLTTGDPRDMGLSLKKLAALPGDYRVLPGHGAATTLERERRSNPYLAAFRRGSDA